jgi:hypothetical protein
MVEGRAAPAALVDVVAARAVHAGSAEPSEAAKSRKWSNG